MLFNLKNLYRFCHGKHFSQYIVEAETKSKKRNMQGTEHHTLALPAQGPQGRQMIKLLCLSSQELTVFLASAG